MAEEQQVTKEPQQVQQATTKNPNKVKAGKRLAEYNCRKREVKKAQREASRGVNQYYGIGFSRAFSTGAVIPVGVIGGLGITFVEPRKDKPAEKYQIILLNCSLTLISLIWIKSLLYYKNGQEEYSK